MLYKNVQTYTLILSIAALAVMLTGCDLFGSDDGEPEAESVVVIGTEVGGDFLTTGQFGLSATALDVDGNSILSEDVDAEVEMRVASSSDAASRLEEDIEIIASVDVDRVRQPSGDDLAVPVNLDGSGSMSWTDPDRNRVDATRAFFNELEDGNVNFESAVVEFPGSNTDPDWSWTVMYQDFTSDADELREAVDESSAGGGTPMWESMLELIEYSEQERPHSNYEKGVILLGDGLNNRGNATLEEVCDAANDADSPIFGVGFGPASDVSDSAESAAVEAMREVSTCTSGDYIGVPDEDVEQAFADAFSGFATGTSLGSVQFNVQIDSGLEEIQEQGVERLEGTLKITSGGRTVEGDFLFGVPEASSAGAFILR